MNTDCMFNNFKYLWISKISSLVPLNIWHRLLNVDLIFPFYHLVSDQNIPHVSGLYKYRNLLQFNADLDFFLRNYNPVNLQDVINHIEGIKQLPNQCFLLTFDDGFREIYDSVAPILYRKGIPAIFFLITSVIDNNALCYPQKKSLLINTLTYRKDSIAEQEVSRFLISAGFSDEDVYSQIRNIYSKQRHLIDDIASILNIDFDGYLSSVKPYLTSSQVESLIKMGFDIGAHSIDHPRFSDLSLEEQLNQTYGSIKWLHDHFRYDSQSFAFPYNDYGISKEFFNIILNDSPLKVTFGTGGMIDNLFPQNISRFTMEKTDLPAEQILTYQFSRTYIRRIFGDR